MTIVEKTQAWYERNRENISASFTHRLLAYNAAEADGKCTIELQSSQLAATVTFWNKGDVEFTRLDLPAANKEPTVIEDRVIRPDESVEVLLNSYVERVRR